MKVPHALKVFEYMYHLHKRNFQAYFKPAAVPLNEPIIKNSVHWVGHATVIINLNGKIIITDPVTSVSLCQIKRLVKPSINIKKLRVDYILLSHGHMDHLSYLTLKKINKDCTVLCPPGYKLPIKLLGFPKVLELKPGDYFRDAFISVKVLKALHDGRRFYLGRNSLSNSYLIKSDEKSVFFAGDTAYTSTYKDLNADIALMPVGCYKPDEYQHMHCSPSDSFKMFKASKSKIMIPIHYKTYILAQDKDEDTVKILKDIKDNRIKIIEIGQTFSF